MSHILQDMPLGHICSIIPIPSPIFQKYKFWLKFFSQNQSWFWKWFLLIRTKNDGSYPQKRLPAQHQYLPFLCAYPGTLIIEA
jgi:hypothetical protein